MKHNVEAFKKYYINATKEEVIEDMFLDSCNLQKEIERLHSIIKEVREYIETKEKDDDNWVDYELLIEPIKIKEILDKENK